MNKKMVFNFLGQIIKAEAGMLLLPTVVCLIYKEWWDAASFGFIIAACLFLGFGLTLSFRPQNKLIFANEGFVITALSWIVLSALGALPFVISGSIPNYFDALFETVSGFTTTGATILTDVESLGHGILFWRSFTHWIGGMGVLVFVMALVPSICDRSIHVMRAEMPGPIVGKLVPKVKQTAKILYLIYIGLTVLMTVMLLAGGMPLFDSIVHAVGTAGTGGFGIKADSIGGYSPYIQWVIAAFMVIFGINFNLYFLILVGKFKTALKSSELWCFLCIIAASTAVIAFSIYGKFDYAQNASDTVRTSFFQVTSIISTSGFATADFLEWSELCKAIILILMFIGGCAGSTGGGLKVSRIMMLFKMIGRELRKMLHPRAVETVRMEGKKLDDQTLSSTANYFAIYAVFFFAIFLLLSFNPGYDFSENFTAVTSCINNIGPAFGKLGPTGSFAGYNAFSKVLLSAAMLLGRLEIYPLLFAFSPSTWTKK